MKYLGIDYGKKRVGLALSDDGGHMAFPCEVLANDGQLLDKVRALIAEHSIAAVVVGHSKNLQGEDNPIQTDISAFCDQLKAACEVDVYLEPEMFSTREAAAATTQKSEKDAAAAAVILNSFLVRNIMSEENEEVVSYISYDDFAKLDIRIGTIVEVAVVEDADKLLKLQVDFGDHTRQIVSGIREFFAEPETLVGTQCPFVINLKPRVIRGEESNGMILAARDEEGLALLRPHQHSTPGTKVS